MQGDKGSCTNYKDMLVACEIHNHGDCMSLFVKVRKMGVSIGPWCVLVYTMVLFYCIPPSVLMCHIWDF